MSAIEQEYQYSLQSMLRFCFVVAQYDGLYQPSLWEAGSLSSQVLHTVQRSDKIIHPGLKLAPQSIQCVTVPAHRWSSLSSLSH